MNGVVVLDKPAGWTSHDAVNKIRRLAQTTKVGHLGTLDPMATGVLPLVVGRATRLAQFVAPGRKSYEATIQFGFSTDSYDADGQPTSAPQPITLHRNAVEHWLHPFQGRILQTPPPVSAKKINGVPAYKLARKQVDVSLAPVEVEIFSVNILELGVDSLQIRVDCGPGTYIRSIAHQLGLTAGCGAHLTALRRLLSSGFTIAQSHTMDQLIELANQGCFTQAIIPALALLPDWPTETVDHLTEQQIRQGRDFRVSPFRGLQTARHLKVASADGDLIAIAEAKMPLVYHPTIVL